MEILDLFTVALMPVLETLIMTAVGLYLALDHVGILVSAARHHLNNVIFYVFIPAIVVSSLAKTITVSSIVPLWFIPVNIFLTFIIGSALGWILAKVSRTPRHLHGLVISCCSAGNLGNLPLIIIPAVCQEKNSPFGDSSTCSLRGAAYASLSMAIGYVYIWTYTYNIIRAYGNGSKSDQDKNENSGITSIDDSDSKSLARFSNSYSEALLPSNHTNYEDHEAQSEQFCLPEDNVKIPILKKIGMQVKRLGGKLNLSVLFTPSTNATIVGILIGVISPIRKLIVGDSAPFRVLESSATMLGDATVPSMTLIVGANILKGFKSSVASLWVILGILVVKYIALPLSGVVVVQAAQHFGLVGSDPLYVFVLMLQYALPPALAIGTITQLFEANESECSVIMLWTYAVASFALTLWTTYFMWLVT